MDGNKKFSIVTHDGDYHADDAFSVAALSLLLGENCIEVTRSRDPEVIKKADYVVDVGGIYNANLQRFDHHQEGGAGVRENGIPYAAFGLVWKHYGEKLCGSAMVANKIDLEIVQPNDAIDNGKEIYKTIYDGVYPFAFYDFLQALSPSWKEGVNIDEVFFQAVVYAKLVLKRIISKLNDNVEADRIVTEIYNNSEDKRLMIFDKYYPSNETLSKFAEPLFIVFPRKDGEWTIKGIKVEKNSFVRRKFLPENWAGKRDSELEEITGVIGAKFCHSGRFIAVAKTKEGILKMAEIALNS